MPTQHCDCGARYRFPDTAIGKRAKCKKCGTILTLVDEDDLAPIPIAGNPFADEVANAVQQEKSTHASTSEAGKPVSAAFLPTSETVGKLGPVVIEEVENSKSYGQNIIAAFLFPTSVNNAITFVVLWVVFVTLQPRAMASALQM